jgi:hypothetical protein
MNLVRNLIGGILAGLLLALGPGLALAGGSVLGHGKVALDHAPFTVSQISIDAWLDDAGVAHGTMEWNGDALPNTNQPGGPSDPFQLEVTDLYIVGNTAYVSAVVVHALDPTSIGVVVEFTFTDNSGTADADEIDGIPIEAGRLGRSLAGPSPLNPAWRLVCALGRAFRHRRRQPWQRAMPT